MMTGESAFRKLNRDVITRRAGGKTIWQPRIECWYSDREYRGEELPGEYAGSSVLTLYNKLGVSKRLYEFNDCIKKQYDASIRHSVRQIDPMTREEKMDTPVGSVTAVYRKNSSNFGEMPVKWWIEDRKDLEVFHYIVSHTTYSFCRDTYDRLDAQWGHLGLPSMFLPRTNLQGMLIDLCGVENTIYLVYDEEDMIEKLFEAMNRSHMQLVEELCSSPFEWINFGDNLHSKVTPPPLFKKYVLPHYLERNHRLHQAGKFTFSHFDGDVKELLPLFRSCGLDGIEAVTPLPQGDVTLKEAKEALGDMFLIDGIAAILFDEEYPLEMLKQQTLECLNLFEGQLVLGISDEMSSTGTLDRILYVKEIVEHYNLTR